MFTVHANLLFAVAFAHRPYNEIVQALNFLPPLVTNTRASIHFERYDLSESDRVHFQAWANFFGALFYENYSISTIQDLKRVSLSALHLHKRLNKGPVQGCLCTSCKANCEWMP
jgi:hypothetical protein